MRERIVLSVAAMFIFCLVAQGSIAATQTLSLGHAVATTDPTHIGATKFAQIVSEKSQGSLKIDIFPSAQLGGDREMIEAVRVGTLHIYWGPTAPQTAFIPQYKVLDLPFLFRDREHVFKVLDGDIGTDLLRQWEAKGIKGLAYADNGFREMLTRTKRIYSVADLKGMKFRIMENPVYRSMFNSLGAAGVPMPWGDTYSALQTGVVDGMEIPIQVIASSKLYEVAPNIAKTNHTFTAMNILMNLKSFQALSAEQQTIIFDSARAAARFERQLVRETEDLYWKQVQDQGVKVNEVADISEFQKRMDPVYNEFKESIGADLINKIKNTP